MALTTIPASLSATAITLTTAAQPNITSVGTLTCLTVSGNIAGTLTTAAQTNITSLGTLTALTVDDITIDGSTISDAADLILDVGGDITLDADGGDVLFKDGGTHFGSIYQNSNNMLIYSAVSDADMLFQGNDGGSLITALTLDMSEAGAANFNNSIAVGGTSVINSSGVLQNVGLSGTYSNALNFSNSSLELSGHMFFNEFSSGRHYIHFRAAGSTNQVDWRIQTSSSNNTIHSWYHDKIYFSTKVGIGEVTASELLHVKGTNASIAIDASGASNTASLKFINDNERSRISSNYDTGGGGRLTFHTDTAGGSLVERMRIDNAGNVGIGTLGSINANAKLHVQDSDGSFPDDSNTHLVVESASHSYIGLGGGTSSDVGIHMGDSGGINRGKLAYLNASDAMVFFTSAQERMRIASTGGVEVTTSGVQMKAPLLQATNGDVATYTGTTPTLHSPASATLAFSMGGAERMRISSSGDIQARRARSNTVGEVALSLLPSDTIMHYGFRIDQNTNSFNLDRVNSPAATLLSVDGNGKLLHGTMTVPTGVLLGNQLVSSSATGSEIIAFRADTSVSVGDKCGALLIGNSDPDGAEDHFIGMWGKVSSTNGSQDLHFAAGRSGYEGDSPTLTLKSGGDVKIVSGMLGIGMDAVQALDIDRTSGLSLRFYESGTFRAGMQSVTTGGQMIATTAAQDFAIRSQSDMVFSAGGNTERMRIKSNGQITAGAATDYKFVETMYRRAFTIGKTYVHVANINSSSLATSYEVHVKGTTSGVVVNAHFHIMVGHYYDIAIKSFGLTYTNCKVKVVSNGNEDHSLYIGINHGTGTPSLLVSIRSHDGSAVDMTPSGGYNTCYLEHAQNSSATQETTTGSAASGAGPADAY